MGYEDVYLIKLGLGTIYCRMSRY